jgi:hypothetical protein
MEIEVSRDDRSTEGTEGNRYVSHRMGVIRSSKDNIEHKIRPCGKKIFSDTIGCLSHAKRKQETLCLRFALSVAPFDNPRQNTTLRSIASRVLG